MGRNPKFLITEIDGVELGFHEEYQPVVDDVFTDVSKTKTVKDKLDSIENGYETFFKYKLDQDFTVPDSRSKIIASCIEVNDNCLIVEGILEIS